MKQNQQWDFQKWNKGEYDGLPDIFEPNDFYSVRAVQGMSAVGAVLILVFVFMFIRGTHV